MNFFHSFKARSCWIAAILFVFGFTLFLPPPPCQAATHRYALSVFHFNIQYVAGGLVGLFEDPCPIWELTEEEVEDMIVVESFEPVLDLYMSHPEWGTNLEMQAYFLDVLAQRHPHILDKLRAAALSGQVEVVSFHYSDQLFLGYPRLDLERSQEMTRKVFEVHGIPLARSVFCQEGQASPAMPPVMEQGGYDYLVWPKNLYRYQHGTPDPVMPYYAFGNLWMVLGPESVDYTNEDEELHVRWTFLDDGELLATGDWDPYFPPFFRHDPEAVAEYEQKLMDLEAQGYKIATVSDYMDDVLQLGIPPADPGPLLEGTWQPDSTNGIYKWMGGPGLFVTKERDNYVRTLCAAAHRELLAAETMTGVLGGKGMQSETFTDALQEAWRLLILGQVTDATGINPFRGEVDYGIAHVSEAIRIARDLIEQAKQVLGYKWASIDTKSGEVLPQKAPVPDEGLLSEDPLQVVVEAPYRDVTRKWTRVANNPTVYKLEVDFSASRGAGSRSMKVTFPGDPNKIVYCPSLQEETPVEMLRKDFIWNHFILPLPNGMIGLEQGWMLVKDTARVHVGAFVFADRPDITFQDETAPLRDPVTWAFYLLEGGIEDALPFANRLNIWPILYR